ncbi:MAG: YihY/virulence factor BrkB family protein [Rikenellaceae bacterium]|nr:YihY/virulence factor BrkB family protein [Rikenellaceae bacterium]
MIKNILNFIVDGIWRKHESEYRSRWIRWCVRQLKIILITIGDVSKHNILVYSSALTFYTMMSLVPILALIFAVVKGFGLQANFYQNLYASFPEYASLIDQALTFANNLLEHTKGGVVAGVGLATLFWSVMKLFGNAETAFSLIWEVKRRRSITRKFSDYITVIIIAPILWILSSSLSGVVRDNLTGLADKAYIDLLFIVARVIVLWGLFLFLYSVMPNTRVRLRNAFTGAAIAGTAFYIFQLAYVWAQSSMMSYNAIYGSFAALPLFLIWLQTSWQIVLFGAELSYAYQNLSNYEQERQAMGMSYRDRQKVMLAALVVIGRRFNSNAGAITYEQIAAELDLPVRIVKDVVFDLENSGFIAATRDGDDERVNRYVPARAIDSLRISDVVDVVENSGELSVLPLDNPLFHNIAATLDGINASNRELDRPLSELVTV